MRLPRCGLLLALLASPLQAQGLEDRITQLFIFGEGDEVLFLGGSAAAANPQVSVHGDHFVPAAVSGNATIISFLTNSIGSNVSNIPVSASSGGETFRFEGATPVRTSISPGPIYAERAQTLGSGRLYVNLSRTGLHYETLRGVPLDAVPLVFTHSNVDFPNCDAIFGGDCTRYGIPEFENETIDFTLGLGVTVDVTAFALTYGVNDRIDLGVVLPLVKTSLRGTSTATIIPFGGSGGPPPHFFSGSEDEPVLTASRFVEGTSSGLGDVSARVKVKLREATPVSLAVLAEGRFPTGSEEDLRGSGAVALRGLGIISARLGDFSPHANLGYQYRGRERDPDVFLLTAGFDQLLAPVGHPRRRPHHRVPGRHQRDPGAGRRGAGGAVPPHHPHLHHPRPPRRHHQRVARPQAHHPPGGHRGDQRRLPAQPRGHAAGCAMDRGGGVHLLEDPPASVFR